MDGWRSLDEQTIEHERKMPLNKVDTCRRYVVPKLQNAGWENEPHRINEQVTFTDGRIVVSGREGQRRPGKRADYILRYRPDMAIAVVEAKPFYTTPGQGLQQAKEYAEILGSKFAYATNGEGIIEFDYITGQERQIDAFPTPDELWARLTTAESLDSKTADRLLTPAYQLTGKSSRCYQEIAINRAVQSVLQGRRRILITIAIGNPAFVPGIRLGMEAGQPREDARRCEASMKVAL